MKKPKIIELSRHFDPRGNLSVIEEYKDIPFKIERSYWIYDVPGGESRGGMRIEKITSLLLLFLVALMLSLMMEKLRILII